MSFDRFTLAVFVLAYVGVAYLLDANLNSRGALYAFLVALAVSIAFSWWLRPRAGEKSGADLSIVSDPAATRRAVQRGITRSALTALIWVGVGFWVLSILTSIWQEVGSRDDRFGAVLGNAFLVAHPGYESANFSFAVNWYPETNLRSLSLPIDLRQRTASAVAPSTSVKLRLSLLGQLAEPPSLPSTPIDEALQKGRPDRKATALLLRQLPRPVTAIAIVEFRRPLSMPAFGAFLNRRKASRYGDPLQEGIPILLQDPYLYTSDGAAAGRNYRPLTWPRPSMAEFQEWAKKLHGSDKKALAKLNLPPVSLIKTVAAEGKVYGYIVDAKKPRLQRLFADPLVRSLRIADVSFDLDQIQPS